MQDDVNARLQASESKTGVTLEESSNGSNPANEVAEGSDSGLAKLDAGKEEDTTPVEDKIEAVAGAIGTKEEPPADSQVA